jgi:NADP-dependent 3-hydroxy acid dehydrogenase YdfG
MESIAGRSVVVTGASSGIGTALAHVFAEAGARLVLGARRVDRLEALAAELRGRGAAVEVLRTDMRVEADVVALVGRAVEAFGGVDVLVNNAGLGKAAPLSSSPSDPWREMLEVNVLGLCIATREAVRDMDRRGVAGHVVHVASMAAHRVPPGSGVYAATKFAVRALTEALRQELRARQSPVRVTEISPGYVETEFAQVYSGDDSVYRRLKALEPGDVARAVLWAVSPPAHVEVHDVLVRPTAQGN